MLTPVFSSSIDDAGIHATRVVSGRRFVRWDTVPNLLAHQNLYISNLPYEFFFAKAVNTSGRTELEEEEPEEQEELAIDPDVVHTLIAQLHAQPLNINILSWKKQTIEHILDGLDRNRIRVASRPQGRDVVFELQIPRSHQTVDIPRWPDVYPQHHSPPLEAHAGPIRNPRPDRERRRKLSTNTNASNTTGSTGSEWSGGSDRHSAPAAGPYSMSGDLEEPDDGTNREPLNANSYDARGHGHGRRTSGSTMMDISATPVVHNHTLTPLPLAFTYHEDGQQQQAPPQPSGMTPSPVVQPYIQHVSRPLPSPSTGGATTFLTTPTPTKKWTRRSSPDRIFMNVTLNGLLRSAGMPIPRQKDDASRLPWSSIPQFLAENGLFVRGWPEANLPWLYSGAGGGGVPAPAQVPGQAGGGGIGEWKDRIDWKSSPSQRSYKPLAQALRNGDIQILPRPKGRDVLFEVRDAQGRCYDSTLGLSDEWKVKWMQDVIPGGAAAAAAVAAPPGEFKFVNIHGRMKRDTPDDEERGRPGYHSRANSRPGFHSRSASYSRSGSARARNMDLELPSPTETTVSSSSGTTKRFAQPRRYQSTSVFPDLSHRGYHNLAYPSEPKPEPKLAYPEPKLAYSYSPSSSFPPNDAHQRVTPPTDREGPSSTIRFPRQYSESIMRFHRPADSPIIDSRKNTPSPNSSQRQRTVSLGTSSASTGTGTTGTSPSFSITPARPGRYNLPPLAQGVMDMDVDMDDPKLNRLPPIIHFQPDTERPVTPATPTTFPRSLTTPSSLPTPVVAFSRPLWSPVKNTWKLSVLDPARASLPPIGDTILWDATRGSWKLMWATGADVDPSALWSAEQEAWILESS